MRISLIFIVVAFISTIYYLSHQGLTVTARSGGAFTEEERDREDIKSNKDAPAHSQGLNSADCLECHGTFTSRLPGITEIRAGWRQEIRFKQRTQISRILCQDCHNQSVYLKPLTALTHKVRSVGEHMECLSCHKMPSATLSEEALEGQDYRADFCFECHRDIERDFVFSDGHRAGRRGVSCIGCHHPHQEMKALITTEMLPPDWLGTPDSLQTNELCLKCHSLIELYTDISGFKINESMNLHQVHIEGGRIGCVECHNPHGGARKHQIRFYTLSGEYVSYQSYSERGGNCTVNCHTKRHLATNYGSSP